MLVGRGEGERVVERAQRGEEGRGGRRGGGEDGGGREGGWGEREEDRRRDIGILPWREGERE